MKEDKQKISICMIGSFPEPIGGVAKVCYYLCRELTKRNIRINFVDTSYNLNKTFPKEVNMNMPKPLNLVMIKCLIFHPLLTLTCLWHYFRLVKSISIIPDLKLIYSIIYEILKINKKETIDIIHSHHANPRSFAALMIGKYLNVPVIITVYCSEFTEESYIQRYLELVKYVTTKSDKVIAISEFTRRKAIEKVGQINIEVIPCGVDINEFRPNYDTTKLIDKYSISDKKIVLYVGWLIARKGPDVLMRAIPLIEDKGNVKFVFIGPDHGLKKKLSQMIEDYCLEDNVILLGTVSDDELKRFYSIADIFIFPTAVEMEGFGIVAVEAMASETPVIASRIAAIPEVVFHGKTGILVEPSNPIELAEVIKKLLENETLREKMGKEGRKLVKLKYDWGNISEEMIKIYLSILKSYRTRNNLVK